MIRAALVGLGWWGQTLIETAAGSVHLGFTVAVSRHPTTETERRAKDHGLRLVRTFEDAVAATDVDAVVLATPPTTHAGKVVAAAQAGKHVYCEKPFTLNKKDAAVAVEAMRKAGKTLALGYNRRFHPDMTILRQMIRSGELGTICHLEATMTVPNALLLKPDAWRAGRTTLFGTCKFQPVQGEARVWQAAKLDIIRETLDAFAVAAEGGAAFLIPVDEMVHGAAVTEAVIRSAQSHAIVPVP